MKIFSATLLWFTAFASLSAADDDLSIAVTVGGMQRYSADRWGLVEATIRNRTSETHEVTIVVTPRGGFGDRFLRTVTIPPNIRFRTSWPVYLSKGLTRAFEFDYIVLRGGPDSQEIISSQTGESTDNFVSNNSGGRWQEQTRSARPPGFCAVISNLEETYPEHRAINEMAVKSRELSRVPPMVLTLRPHQLHGVPELLDSADQMFVSATGLHAYPELCEAIRIWIQRGGKAVIMLPICGEETARAILGDALPFTLIDTTTPMRVPLQHHPKAFSAGHPDRSHLREFEEPIEMTRCVFERGKTLWSVRDWPALVSAPVGRGHVFVSTLSPQVFDHEDPTDHLDAFAGEIVSTAFGEQREQPLLSRDVLTSATESRIGYEIPGRGFATLVLVLFSIVVAVAAWRFRMSDHAGRLLLIIPAVAVFAAVPGLILGSTARSVAPTTLIECRVAQVPPGQATFAADGVATVYYPDADADTRYDFDAHCMLEVPPDRRSGGGKRFIWIDRTRMYVPGLQQPAGTTTYGQRSVVRLKKPLSAYGSLTQDGLLLKLPGSESLQPADIVLAHSGPDKMTVRPADEGFLVTDKDVLPPRQFSNATLLTAEQNRRAEIFRHVFEDDRVNRFPNVLSVLFWSDQVPPAILPKRKEMRHSTVTLFSLPIEIQPPPLEQPIQLPPILLPYRLVADKDGSMPATFSRRTGNWVQKKDAATTVLQFDLPPECCPFEFESADVRLRIRAGSRTVLIQGGTLEDLKDITTLDEPVTTVPFRIPADILNANPDRNSVLLRISVSDLKEADEKLRNEQDNFWKIERILLSVRGKKISAPAEATSP